MDNLHKTRGLSLNGRAYEHHMQKIPSSIFGIFASKDLWEQLSKTSFSKSREYSDKEGQAEVLADI